MATFSYGTYQQYAPYIYDKDGKTIGFKLKNDNGKEVYSSEKALSELESLGIGHVSKSIDGEEWILLEGYENINPGEALTVEDFSVDELTNMFLSGNLTWFEYGRGLEANGATDVHCLGGEGGLSKVSMSYTLNGKNFYIDSKYEDAVSQVDDNNIIQMAQDYYSRISVENNVSILGDKVQEAPGGMVKYGMWDIYNAAATEFIYQYFGYIPSSDYSEDPLTDEQRRFVNANPQIFHYGYGPIEKYGECISADNAITMGIDSYLLHKAQLEEDICAYGNRLYRENIDSISEKCKRNDDDPIYSLSYKKFDLNDGTGRFIETVEFTDKSIAAIMSALNDSDSNKAANACKVFGLSKGDSEATVRTKIEEFCKKNGSKDGKTVDILCFHKALADAGIEGIKSHDECYAEANANCANLESYQWVKADEEYYNSLYESKGGYDMFGNGNPPGPNGSIPLGDGKYIRYEMSEDDALAQGYLKIDVNGSRQQRYAIVYETDSDGNITNERKIVVNEVPLSMVTLDPVLSIPPAVRAVLESMVKFDIVGVAGTSASSGASASRGASVSSSSIEDKIPQGAVSSGVDGIYMKLVTKDKYVGGRPSGEVETSVVYYVYNPQTENFDIAGSSAPETYYKGDKQKETEILEKANNNLIKGDVLNIFNEQFLSIFDNYSFSDSFTRMMVYISGMNYTSQSGIVEKDGEFYNFHAPSKDVLLNAINSGKDANAIVNLFFEKTKLSQTPDVIYTKEIFKPKEDNKSPEVVSGTSVSQSAVISAEAKPKVEAEIEVREEAEAKPKAEAEIEVREEVEARAKAEAEVEAREGADVKAHEEAEAKAAEEARKQAEQEKGNRIADAESVVNGYISQLTVYAGYDKQFTDKINDIIERYINGEISKTEFDSQVKSVFDTLTKAAMTETRVDDAEKDDNKPPVLIVFDNYEAEAVEQAKKQGLIRDEKTGLYSKYDPVTHLTYNWLWDPETKKFDVYTNAELNTNNPDDRIIRLRQRRQAIIQRLSFTADSSVCVDKDGNYYDYNEATGKFEIRK